MKGHRLRFEDGAADLVRDYEVNGKRSLEHAKRRIELHLKPFFGGRRLAAVSTADVRRFTAERQEAGASNAEINRELALLKRIYSLAMQAGILYARPYIPMLAEHNIRQGFFERAQFEAVRAKLSPELQDLVTVAHLTGWRVPSELLTMRWSQVDLEAKTLRLEPGTTKNDDGRLFPFKTLPELEAALVRRKASRDALKAKGTICPWVFERAGEPITWLHGEWRAACKAAGCPGRILHDFRRTAVRNLVRAGVPELTAMMLTGHKTRSVFDRYDIVNEADLSTAVERLSDSMVSATVSAKGPKRSKRARTA